MRILSRWLLLVSSCCGVGIGQAADYERDIQPLLEHKCYACHGALKQQGGLRVDTAAALRAGGESGAAVVAGKPEASLLIDVLTGAAGFQMPPEGDGARLTAAELELVRSWIAAGAPAPEDETPQADPAAWWSYRPLTRPPLPSLSDASWCRTPVDFFVAAERQNQGLPVNPATDKSHWLRRVYLDLLGLPPDPQAIHAFLSDPSPDAYERVVDELLSRPEYGQRWGRHWMDVWRYSDWYGSRGGNEIRYSQRHIWRWRDWIVDALNADKPYDQMLREMLAGDELAGETTDSLAATGYLGRSWYKFDRDVWMFDTVERCGEAFLGVTLRCCRCHDHKFDPISQEEYYRFRAFFEPHDVRSDPTSAMSPLEKDPGQGEIPTQGLAVAFDQWPERPTYRFQRGDSRFPDSQHPLQVGVPQALGGSLQVEPVELSPLVWYPALRPAYRATLIAKAELAVREAETALSAARHSSQQLAEAGPTAIDPDAAAEVLFHDDFAAPRPELWDMRQGKWTYAEGKLLQSQVTDFATLLCRQPVTGNFKVQLRYRPLPPGSYRSIGFSFDGQPDGSSQDVYTSTGDAAQSVQAFHRLAGRQVYPPAGIVSTPLAVGQATVLDVSLVGEQLSVDVDGVRKLDYQLPVPRRDGHFALWVHQGAAEFLELKITRLADSAESWTARRAAAEQHVVLAEARWRLAEGELLSLQRRLAAELARYVERDLSRAEGLTPAAIEAEQNCARLTMELAVAEAAGDPEKLKLAKQRSEKEAATSAANAYSPVGPQYPRTSTGRRLALANWITQDANPRTARVAANHLWTRHFGQPLVATPENFGLNGRQPTHPQLLDWLASELIAHDWQMKPLHKQLLLSATYRLSSATHTPSGVTAQAADPQNRYLWRASARRMEAEVVRDATLHLAGLLDPQMGGPEIPETQGEQSHRRSIYFRHTPNERMPLLEIFDGADANACYRRKESIVPHQALVMLNSGLTQDAARRLAAALANESDFVSAAFQRVLGRLPTQAEAERCHRFLEEHPQLLQTPSPHVFSAGGTSQQSPAADNRLRAQQNLVHVLFSHHDFVTIK